MFLFQWVCMFMNDENKKIERNMNISKHSAGRLPRVSLWITIQKYFIKSIQKQPVHVGKWQMCNSRISEQVPYGALLEFQFAKYFSHNTQNSF